MELPLISIAISFHNDEKFLKFAINSILKQSYKNWELILIDDGSTDQSKKIAESFVDSRIKIYSDGICKGLAARLNQSIAISKGKFYARMDADDVMLENRIETQLKYLESNPDVDLCGSRAYLIDVNNRITGFFDTALEINSYEDILKYRPLIHPSVMGKSEWFRKNKYRENLKKAQDFELWLRTANTSTFKIIEEPLLFYRSTGNMSLQKYKQSNRHVIQIIKEADFINSKVKSRTILKFQIKSFIYIIFSFFNITKIVTQKKGNHQLSKEKISEIEREKLFPMLN